MTDAIDHRADLDHRPGRTPTIDDADDRRPRPSAADADRPPRQRVPFGPPPRPGASDRAATGLGGRSNTGSHPYLPPAEKFRVPSGARTANGSLITAAGAERVVHAQTTRFGSPERSRQRCPLLVTHAARLVNDKGGCGSCVRRETSSLSGRRKIKGHWYPLIRIRGKRQAYMASNWPTSREPPTSGDKVQRCPFAEGGERVTSGRPGSIATSPNGGFD